ncbi:MULTISPECIES: ORF6N domain-containing protein [unclassified Pedobacter]|uniref:ORF6N domain-containing protein n=1 Tax=unclassified Pedobacter TaxID=2628915 RepID=UPI0014232767|nr:MULTISPECIES: ORF6N domain-containing protein [unclassified Pedobacter]NII85975.1 tetrahydromethanopterin S-methyltransferase subunit G [Pedobacter sp. SG908]NMN39111.1 tetrahydromethanopterin S-methyltransferase subunit G [Pedobacter sp. SG918]
MTAKTLLPIIPDNIVVNKIYELRGLKVMLDSDLAELYGVETKRLNEQVGRNPDRFPKDFMFQLTDDEWLNLKSQFATSSWGGRRKLPYVFTEHGILMLSSVLNSKQAIQVNIQIVKIFSRIRQFIFDNGELKLEIEEIKKTLNNHDKNIELVFTYLDRLIDKKIGPRKRIGYMPDDL